MQSEEINKSAMPCPHCSSAIDRADVFCGYCGKEILSSENTNSAEVFSRLAPTLLYYFITLILLAIYKFTEVFPQGLDGLLIVSGLDIIFVFVFWLNNFAEVGSLFRLRGLSLRVMMLTVAGAIIGSAVVSVIADFINHSIQDDVFYNTFYFAETSNPLLFATFLIAVQPAIFEEIAFRGFLFNNLKEIAGDNSAVYISAFIFGIMHLAFISLIWLIPIGLAFGFLRSRYNTIWYGIVGHFVYNFSITLYEFWNWF